jgi:glycosyltransferase involved in cell wall biosynthesis
MKKLLVLTDMVQKGSGYRSISIPLFSRLSKEYEIRIVGLGYNGEEHSYPFSILPCKDTNDAHAIIHNLNVLKDESPDVIIVALDIPLQTFFFDKFKQYKKPYIAITPLENPPLTMSWAAQLLQMSCVFFISELGKQAGLAAGLKNVDHLEIGIDSDFWRVPTPEEKQGLRKGMDIAEDEYVILTVADNQERKNLWASLGTTCLLTHDILYSEFIEITEGKRKISEFKRNDRKIKHILVTRVETPFGHKITDLCLQFGINQEVVRMNRGMSNENLWSLYALSDCFLLTSKAEGLGLPVMEAMSCGLPVVATDTGAIHELLQDDRGFLIPPEYTFGDVWGNSARKMIDIEYAKVVIQGLISKDEPEYSIPARQFIEKKTWDISAKQLGDKIEEVVNYNRMMNLNDRLKELSNG